MKNIFTILKIIAAILFVAGISLFFVVFATENAVVGIIAMVLLIASIIVGIISFIPEIKNS